VIIIRPAMPVDAAAGVDSKHIHKAEVLVTFLRKYPFSSVWVILGATVCKWLITFNLSCSVNWKLGVSTSVLSVSTII